MNCKSNNQCGNEHNTGAESRNCTKELLEELEKDVHMATLALNNIMPKVKNSDLSAEFVKELGKYSEYSDQISKMIRDAGGEPKDANVFSKITSKVGIEMNTLTDPTDEHIAQMAIEGTTMGITDIIRQLRDFENSNCSEEALSLAREIVSYQEKTVEKLKSFL